MENLDNTIKKSRLTMRLTLILFALIPMIVTTLISSIVTIQISSTELKQSTHNAMVEVVTDIGNSFDYSTDVTKTTMNTFATSPIIMNYLKDPTNEELANAAEKYTQDFFGKLDGWEGIYLADWNSKVLTHPTPPVIGKTMREGEALDQLHEAMLNTENGVYNAGIIASPASDELIMSMYMPIFDNNKPIGYIGAGTFVNNTAEKFSDVSNLGLTSAYVYFVSPEGTMLYHPDPEKIGNPVENEAVKTLVARIGNGEHPTPECVEYKYKGAMKYAAYYVDDACNYIAVLTADESDAMAAVQTVIFVVIGIAIACLIAFIIIALCIARIIARPLTVIADATTELSTGNIAVECNAKSHIRETIDIITAFNTLKTALQSSIGNVKNSTEVLNEAIVTVDDKTAHNVESVSQISSAIEEVATTSQAVAENAQIMAERADLLGQNIENLTANVEILHDASLTIREANNEATACMMSVLEGSDKSVDAMTTINSKISDTNAAIANISNAVQAIEAIASQTNLLSLNASIEAARAGEAGRGFAVVADEIRQLADQSAASAKDIKKTVEEIIALSNETVEVSENVFNIINTEKADITTTQDKFAILSQSVDESIDKIETINNMTSTLNNIKVELANATTDLGAISEELGASAEEVSASCQTVSGACTDTQASTEEMRAINENMVAAVDFFKL